MILLKSLLLEATSPSTEEVALQFLQDILTNSPYAKTAFLAGGAVRDEIMGKPIKDIDIVVAEKEGGIAFANWLTKKINAHREGSNPVIYPRFGTAKFNLRGVKYKGVDLSTVDIESVMTRGEKYETGSRKPEVVYADLKTDAERRDLTVNSLFKNLVTGQIQDLTGRGIADIKNGVVRTPLDPDITFQDDPLRMMRAVRFAVKYNWKMPLSLVKALKRNADKLPTISAERIQEELNKMLVTERPDMALKLLSLTGLNKYIIPELDATHGVKQNEHHEHDVFEHILQVVKKSPPNLPARLSALFHDIGKPETKTVGEDGRVHFYQHEEVGAQMAQEIMARLKYSSHEISTVSNVVNNHMRLKFAGGTGSNASDKVLRKFRADLGDDLPVALDMMHADNISHKGSSAMPNQIPVIQSRMKELGQASPAKPKLPISGHDIMSTFNMKPGPEIKKILAAVEDAWFDNPSLDRDQALQIAKKAYAESPENSIGVDRSKMKVRNPETERDILVMTALKYDKDHPARKAAEKKIHTGETK